MDSGKKPVRKVLVEGDAGVGKTTFCTSISEDWAYDRIFTEFELLLHLPLRLKEVTAAQSFSELLGFFFSDPDSCKSLESDLRKSRDKTLLIIADGWDESTCQEKTFLYKLLFGFFLPFVSVVLTSRPSASAQFHRSQYIDRFTEIHGFNKDSIIEYIRSEFTSNQDKADRLLEQLVINPLVESVCSIPLNCAIVCHLWCTLEEALPTTMTELYTKIVLNFVLRNLQKIDKYSSIIALPNFDCLPAELKESWWLLCEFASHAMEKDQIVFSQEELTQFSPQGFDMFGLLQYSESILDVGCGISIHFLHLTFQEYLSALFLARQPPNKQNLICYRTHFAMVWRFFFGTYFHGSKVQTRQFDVRQVIEYASESKLSLCHFAFEAQSDVINNEVIYFLSHGHGDVAFGSPVTAHDCAAILHIIANMLECNDMAIDFSYSNIRVSQIRKLMSVLACKHGMLKVKSLNLSGNKLANKCVSKDFLKSTASFQLFDSHSDNRIRAKLNLLLESLLYSC